MAEEFTDDERAAIRRFLTEVSAIYDDFASGAERASVRSATAGATTQSIG